MGLVTGAVRRYLCTLAKCKKYNQLPHIILDDISCISGMVRVAVFYVPLTFCVASDSESLGALPVGLHASCMLYLSALWFCV